MIFLSRSVIGQQERSEALRQQRELEVTHFLQDTVKVSRRHQQEENIKKKIQAVEIVANKKKKITEFRPMLQKNTTGVCSPVMFVRNPQPLTFAPNVEL